MLKDKFSLIALASALALTPLPLRSAEKVVFRWTGSIIQPTIPTSDLVELAETGQASRDLQFYLERTKQSPENLRLALTTPISIHGVRLSQFLNSPLGEIILDQLGEVIQTSANVANRQALRAALVQSALPDNQLTLLEVIQNYPNEGVYLNGDRLSQITQQIHTLAQILGL
ncbi:MAG: alpha/beta hydrolase [Pseudanabaenaceae cyanobacterium]